MEFNEYQTPVELLGLENEPDEVLEWFWQFINTVPLIRYMVSKDRPRACDLPRDEEGKIIVDVTRPHILENVDYFRKAAICFLKNGYYTNLRPNKNPNSEFGKWIREEIRRCYEGLIRPEDGEWIPGDLYWFWNYSPMQVSKQVSEGSKESRRVFDLPSPWEGHYLKFHMLDQARKAAKHYIELASRGKGKSYSAASLLSKRFKIGESQDNKKGVQCFITAYEKKYLDEGGTLKKFQDDISHLTKYMPEIPHRMTNDSLHDMKWTMGYKDVDTGVLRGTGNQVIGITSKDDEAKLRGTRGVLFAIEEAGNFPRLKQLWSNMLPSVEDGEKVFGLLMAFGTAGDSESDFEAMQEMMYHPDGYHIYSVENVYDKMGEGAKRFGYFFPAYVNYGSFQNKDGVSDVTAALLYLLKERYKVKYETSDQNALFKKISEYPITPQEATLRTKPSIFPVVDIRKRLNQLDNDPNIVNSNIVGDLDFVDGKACLTTTSDVPIRSFFNQNNSMAGAIEFFELPHKDSNGKIPNGRYIAACDPIDEDSANTSSLFSMFVMDKITGIIMCEWTGRLSTADECYEKARRICYFYNATMLIENNKIGIVAYFKRMGCIHMLAETPEWLFAKDIIKTQGYGNRALGVNTRANTIVAADERIKQWLLSPYTEITDMEDGINQVITTMCYTLKSHALLEELLTYNPMGNFDRVRAFGILMLYYEEFVSKGANVQEDDEDYNPRVDDFFYKVLHKKRN